MNSRRLRRGSPARSNPSSLRATPRATHPLAAAMLSAGLLLSVQAAQAQASQAAAAPAPQASQARNYDIPPAPLADVLNRYAAEAGVVLVFDAA